MAPLCSAVVKAIYDYEPQSDDELAIKEGDVLCVLDDSDPEWWKVRHKTSSQEEDGPSGVVPSTYVEEAEPIAIVKALYDYEAGAEGELSVKEGDVLVVYDREEDWILVKGEQRDSRVGYVPGTYVEDHNPDEATAAEPAAAPVSTYVDPQERVQSTVSTSIRDDIETWPVTEIDAKGKKRKGTLGVGNGNVFFASESDKTPVQQWKVSNIASYSEDKPKHVALDISGPNAAQLHFNANSKDVASAIIAKLESSRALLQPSQPAPASPLAAEYHEPEVDEHEEEPVEEAKPKKNGVHWASSPTSPISASYPSTESVAGEAATAMYDFEAQSEDELTVHEGDVLVVVDRVSSEDWWKCRNQSGQEGVVPSSYVELDASETAAATAAAEENERMEEEAARARAEAESEAAAAAAEEAAARAREEAEERRRQQAAQKRREDERRMAEQRRVKDEERARRKAEEARAQKAAEARRAEEAAKEQAAARRSSRADDGRHSRSRSDRPSTSDRAKPTHTRIWHDRTGQFKVEAEFLGYANGKIKLHKSNGVVIEVPSEKMSPEDMAYIEHALNPRKKSVSRAESDDNVPLATIADQNQKRQTADKRASATRQATGPTPTPRKSNFDWFEFFLNAGCDIDDCTRYANAFERDKIDETILGDIRPETMRALGLREGDIIRVAKAIEGRKFDTAPKPSRKDSAAVQEQLRKDEEYARQLQSELEGSSRASPSSPPPNLFTGPGGTLKSTRRGRPQTKTTAPIAVDVSSIASASDRLTQSPAAASPSLIPTPSSVAPPPAPVPKQTRPLTPVATGFDDNAWEPKPITKPTVAPTPPPVIPPTPPASAPPPPPPPAPPAPPVQAQIPRSNSAVAPTTDFELIAKLNQMRPPSAPASNIQPQLPSFTTTAPPLSFSAGLGMGASPVPLAQLQVQQTGMMYNAPRGPIAPVPSNQGLLNPLIPTNTGFAGFIPTRPTSTPVMHQPVNLLPQPTGYPAMMGGMRPQSTGFPTPGPPNMMSMMQSQPTGFNPGFQQQQPMFTGMQPPMQSPPLQQQQTSNHSPANVFASMKSGAFAADGSQPQAADKYEALRVENGAPQSYTSFLTAQPTGFVSNTAAWNMTGQQGPGGYNIGQQQNGYGGYQPR